MRRRKLTLNLRTKTKIASERRVHAGCLEDANGKHPKFISPKIAEKQKRFLYARKCAWAEM